MTDEDGKPRKVVHVEKFDPASIKKSRKIVRIEKIETPVLRHGNSSSNLGHLGPSLSRKLSLESDIPDNFRRGKPLLELLTADVHSTSGESDGSRKVAKVEPFEPKVIRRQTVVSVSAEEKTPAEINGLPKRKVVSVESFELPTAKSRCQKPSRKAAVIHTSIPAKGAVRSASSYGTHLPPLPLQTEPMAQSLQAAEGDPPKVTSDGSSGVSGFTAEKDCPSQGRGSHQTDQQARSSRGGEKARHKIGQLKKAHLARLNEKIGRDVPPLPSELPPLSSSSEEGVSAHASTASIIEGTVGTLPPQDVVVDGGD